MKNKILNKIKLIKLEIEALEDIFIPEVRK